MRKRSLSAVLAILLALSMSFSSFAMEITDNVVTEEVAGASEEVTSTEERVLTEESSSVEESTQAEESFTEENTSIEDPN